MDSSSFAALMPVGLGAVMFGLGLTLTVADFALVLRYPKAALLALCCQLLILPLVCLGLVLSFDLNGALAVGMMLLAASPGGIAANLFSHLAGGDVALNITLTAVNSVISVFTMPVVIAVSMRHFLASEAAVGLQFGKLAQVIAIVLVPVALGMLARARYPGWAMRSKKAVTLGSVAVLVAVIAAAVVTEFDTLVEQGLRLLPATLLLSVCSLSIGYLVPRLFRVHRGQAIASAMEIGIHNATIAIAVATSVLADQVMAIPGAIYGLVMFGPAAIAAAVFRRTGRGPEPVPMAVVTGEAP
ncbi:bile acid:sodium symporter family protein [Nocardia cyriacigeorgica]|uniref:bile acid:sodium symporter family protein n=1 Tax=Nocardia cyriacigeorgica TaxID=135487 RepID=UPI002454E8EF|nr:bile acid:sodium symporter family protein [Nocardia cyriacigeorgica]